MKHGVFPFEFLGWDETDPDTIQLHDVTWLEDWGPFRKSQLCSSLYIDYGKGVIDTYDEAGNVLLNVKFRCVYVDS